MAKNLLSNSEVIASLGLPASTMTALSTAEGETFKAVANDFMSALVNKICYQKVEKMNFSDPFKKYDGFPVSYGDTIENVFVEPPVGYKFDPDATDPFAEDTNSTVKTLYATINFDQQYHTIIQKDMLKRAVLTEGGLMNLIDTIVSSVGTQLEIDTYEATVRMLNNSALYKGGFTALDVSSKSTDEDKYKTVALTIAQTITDFALPSNDNNKLGVKNVCPKEHALVIIRQDILDHINFDYLAGVYNLSKVQLANSIIPVRDFRTISVSTSNTASSVGTELGFVILDDRGFDNHIALRDGGTIYNPKSRKLHQYTDLWKIIAYKYWFNAKAFTLKTSA